jgi:hypothetical protein
MPRDIGVRQVAAKLHPEHDTTAAFRRAAFPPAASAEASRRPAAAAAAARDAACVRREEQARAGPGGRGEARHPTAGQPHRP